MRFSKTAALAAFLFGSAAAAPASAQTFIDFTGTDGVVTMTGTAEASSEGFEEPLLGFDATITNLLAEGGPVDSVTFTLADVAGGYWFDPSNPSGIGSATFTFTLNGNGPDQSTYSADACYFDCLAVYDYDGFQVMLTTTVTDYSSEAVPEPGSLAIMGTGLVSLAGYRLRRRMPPALIAS